MSENDTLDKLRTKVLHVIDNPLPASAYANTTVEEMKAFLKQCEMPWPNAEQKAFLRSIRADDYTSDSSDEEGSVEYIDFHISTDDEDPELSDDESSAKIHEKEGSLSAPEEVTDILPVDVAVPSEAEHETTESTAQVDDPQDNVALSKHSNDRSADSDCFEAGTLLVSLDSAAPSSDVGQNANLSMPADQRGVAAKNMALEILRREAQSSAPGSASSLA